MASKSWTASEAACRAWRWRQFERRHSASTDERRSARGSLPSSAGSCAPIAVSTIPSRSAHSLTVSSFSPVAAIRCPSTEMPAGTSSARRTSQPGSLARSSTVSSKIFADTAARSLALTVSWFTASGSEPSRIAAAMRASDTKVPEEPISIFGWRSAISASTGASSEEMRWCRRSRSFGLGGSEDTSSAVSRPTPSRTLAANDSPVRSPTISSRLPPPRSAASAGPGSMSTLERMAVKISRASRTPSTTSISTPVSVRTLSTKTPPSNASRIAAVPSATTSSTRCASPIALKRRMTSMADTVARSPMLPVRATRSPSLSISFSRRAGRSSRRASPQRREGGTSCCRGRGPRSARCPIRPGIRANGGAAPARSPGPAGDAEWSSRSWSGPVPMIRRGGGTTNWCRRRG